MKCNVANGWCPSYFSNPDIVPFKCSKCNRYQFSNKEKIEFVKECEHRLRINRLQSARRNDGSGWGDRLLMQWDKEKGKIE